MSQITQLKLNPSDQHGSTLESFRTLRTNLLYSDSVNVITVTSTLAHE